MTRVELYTDGACSGNPGPGGWGAILIHGSRRREMSGGERETTNNRMEMMAVIKGVEALNRSCLVHIHTDSTYVMKGMTEWMDNWKKKGWKTSARKPVKNVDLWQKLDEILNGHQVKWHWVKGHSGVAENERADELARLAVPAGDG